MTQTVNKEYLKSLEKLHDVVRDGKDLNRIMAASDAVTAVKIRMGGKR